MFKKSFLILSFFSFLFLGFGCGPYTSTAIKSTKGSGFVSGKIYRKLLVEVQDRDGRENIHAEWIFRDILQNGLLLVIPSSDLFQPGQEVSQTRLTQEGIDGILIVNLKDVQQETIYHPPEASQTTVTSNKDGTVTSRTQYSEGYHEHKVIQKHELTLFDVKEAKPIWIGSATTVIYVSNWTDDKNFLSSLAQEAQMKLAKDGLIQIPKK